MTRAQLIEAYKQLAYDEGEYDVWDEDIEPKLKNMSTKEIATYYHYDKEWYETRKNMVQA